MNEKKRLLRNTGLIAFSSFGVKIVSFLLLPLYTSILSTQDYGTYDFIAALSAFLLPIVTVCINEALFRFLIDATDNDLEIKRYVTNSLVIIVINILILGCILIPVHIFLDFSYTLYLWIYVGTSAIYAFSINLLRGQGKIKAFSFISAVRNVLTLFLNVLTVAVLRAGVEGLILSLIISEIVVFIIVFIYSKLWKQFNFKYYDRMTIKKMLKYSFPLVPNTLSSSIINVSDRLIISLFMGPSANGIYSIAYKFPSLVETVYHYFYLAWSESASRVFAEGKKVATSYYQSMYDAVNNMIFSVFLILCAGMPFLFRIFVRGDYVDGFYYVPLLILAIYFDSLAKFYSGIFTALKKTSVLATTTMSAAIINIIVNVLLIIRWGLFAAVISTLIANIVLVLLRRKALKNDLHINHSFKTIIIQIIVAITVISMYSYDNWWKITIALIVSLIYSVVYNRKVIITMLKILSKR